MPTSSSVIKLSRFRADVARALNKRGRALLEAQDLPAEVAALAPLEAYFIIKELGVDEALPILHHVSDEQLQACIDLDCWDGDAFSPEDLDAWLAAYANEGWEPLANAFLKLDEEVQVLFLASSMHVMDTRSDNIPETPDDMPRMTTTDGFFVLVVESHVEREVEPFALVEALYKHDVENAIRLLMAAKWELPSNSQEQAWQFRSGRVADLGFPSADAAAALFTPPAKAAPALSPSSFPQEAATLPALYASQLTDASLFCRAMGHISEAATVQRLENELVQLVNAAVVAYGDTPRDLQHVTDVATRVRDMLSLGLESAASAHDGDEEITAASLLQQWPLRYVFQCGYGEILPLHRAARALAQDPIVAAWLNVTLSPDDDPERLDRNFLRALVQARPTLSGFDPLRADRARTWASGAEIAASKERLDALSQRLL